MSILGGGIAGKVTKINDRINKLFTSATLRQ